MSQKSTPRVRALAAVGIAALLLTATPALTGAAAPTAMSMAVKSCPPLTDGALTGTGCPIPQGPSNLRVNGGDGGLDQGGAMLLRGASYLPGDTLTLTLEGLAPVQVVADATGAFEAIMRTPVRYHDGPGGYTVWLGAVPLTVQEAIGGKTATLKINIFKGLPIKPVLAVPATEFAPGEQATIAVSELSPGREAVINAGGVELARQTADAVGAAVFTITVPDRGTADDESVAGTVVDALTLQQSGWQIAYMAAAPLPPVVEEPVVTPPAVEEPVVTPPVVEEPAPPTVEPPAAEEPAPVPPSAIAAPEPVFPPSPVTPPIPEPSQPQPEPVKPTAPEAQKPSKPVVEPAAVGEPEVITSAEKPDAPQPAVKQPLVAVDQQAAPKRVVLADETPGVIATSDKAPVERGKPQPQAAVSLAPAARMLGGLVGLLAALGAGVRRLRKP